MARFAQMMLVICAFVGWAVLASSESAPCVSAPNTGKCASEESDEMPLLNLRQKRGEPEHGVSPPAPTPDNIHDAVHVIETTARSQKPLQVSSRAPNGTLSLLNLAKLMDPIDRMEVTEVRDSSHTHDAHTIHPRTEGAGTVAGLYTIGSPSSAWPAMRNAMSSDGCFPGLRATNRADLPGWLWGIYPHINDYVTWVATRVGFFHPFMNMLELVGEVPENSVVDNCNETTSTLPAPDDTRSISLHSAPLYVSNLKKLSEADASYSLAHVMAFFARVGYMDDPVSAAEMAAEFSIDWTLVGWAENAGSLFRTKDSSCLLQNKNTLDCALTFQGSEEPSDFATDVWAVSVEFCGFADSEDYDENGNRQPKANSSFVHEGFRNQLMRIVDTDPFQNDIKPKLSKCNQVYVTGHSLGGAMAELFTGCAHRAPALGEPGSEHYVKIGWQTGTPELMPAYASSS